MDRDILDSDLPSERNETGGRFTMVVSRQRKGEPEVVVKVEDGVIEANVPKEAVMADKVVMITQSRGFTLSIGSYETGRLGIGVSMPCDGTDQGMDEAYERGKAFIQKKLDYEVANLTNPRK